MPSPTSCLGQREDVLDPLLGQDRATGGDPADHRHVRSRRAGRRRAGLVVRRLLGRATIERAGREHLGQEHLERARPVGVALEEALLLEHLELVGDAGGAGQPDRVADLAHAGRVAAQLDGVLDVRQHAQLARRQAGGVRRAVGELADLCACRRPGAACRSAAGHGAAFRFAAVGPGRTRAGVPTVAIAAWLIQTSVRTACRDLRSRAATHTCCAAGSTST